MVLCLEANSENMMFQFLKCISSQQYQLYSEFVFENSKAQFYSLV